MSRKPVINELLLEKYCLFISCKVLTKLSTCIFCSKIKLAFTYVCASLLLLCLLYYFSLNMKEP